MTMLEPLATQPAPAETSAGERFRFQLSMLEKGAAELQRGIGRLDDILFKIKASGVTVWVALVGWAFTTQNLLLIPLGGVVIVGFWLLEGYFRGLQARYLERSLALTELLNDRARLDRCFATGVLPDGAVYPMTLRETELTRLRMYARGLISPTVSILWIFLAFINYLLWIVRDA